MLAESSVSSFFEGINPDVAEALKVYEEQEDWRVEQTDEGRKLIESIGNSMSLPGRETRIQRVPPEETLALMAHCGFRRSLRICIELFDDNAPYLSNALTMQVSPGSEDATWQECTFNRLLLLARVHLLKEIFSAEHIRLVSQAIDLAKRRGLLVSPQME